MDDARPRGRRTRSKPLKSAGATACAQPGASVAAVALAPGVNMNLAHKWRGCQAKSFLRRPGPKRDAGEPQLACYRRQHESATVGESEPGSLRTASGESPNAAAELDGSLQPATATFCNAMKPAPRPKGSLFRHALTCAAAGAFTGLAFAPFAIVPAAWLGVAVLFVAWERSTLRHSVPLGFAFGLGLFVTGAYWLLPGLSRHGGYSALAALCASAFVIVLLAAHVALAGLCRSVAPRYGVALRLLVVMPAAFVLAEWLRSFTLTGFPWLALGYGQIDGPLAGFAPLGGVHAVSFVSAMISGAFAWAWMERRRWMVSAAIVVATLSCGLALSRITWTTEYGRPIEVAAVQGNVHSDIKWTPDQLQPTLDLYARATQSAWQKRRLDLVVWPETAIPARPDQVAPFVAGLQQAARAAGATVAYGIIDVDRAGTEARYYNAMLAAGVGEGAYRKRHLVPLTEFLPSFMPEDWRRRKIRDAIAIFSPGASAQPPIRVADIAIGVTICYETAYGRLVRDPDGTAGILMSITNDDWFMGTTMPAQDHQVARMRALESGREMLRAANSGITAWITSDGRVAAELPTRERATLFAQMRARTGLTPYWRWGEWTWLVPVLAALVASGGLRLRPNST